LKVATYIGLFTAIIAVVYGILIIGRTILFGNPVPGYPSLLVIMLFLGGVQLVSLGIIGEYVGRIFNETKQRPLYLVDAILPAQGDVTTPPSLSADGSLEASEAVPRDAE
jgi:glycosyltransferase involved in cell wall biosynthesis